MKFEKTEEDLTTKLDKDPRFAPFYKTLTGESIKAPEAKIQKELATDVVEITPKTKKTIKKNKAKENFEQGKKLYVENLPNRIATKEAEIADSVSIRYEYKEQLTELNKEIKRLENKKPEIVDIKTDETTIERNKFLTKIKNLETRTNPAYTKRLQKSISELEKKSASLEIPDTRLQGRINRKKTLLTGILDGTKQQELKKLEQEYSEFLKQHPEPKKAKTALTDRNSELSNLKDQRNVLLTKMEIEKNRLEAAKKEVSGLQKELKVENKREKGKLKAQRQKQRSEEAKLNPKTNETGGGRIARTKQKNKAEEEVLEYKPTPEQLDRLRRLNVQIAHLSNERADLYEKSHDIMFKLYGGNRSFYGAAKATAIIQDYSKRMDAAKKISNPTQRNNTIGSLMKQGNHELMSIQDIGLIKKVSNLTESLKTASEAEKPAIKNEIKALKKQIKKLEDENKQIKEAIDKLHQKSRPLEKEAISIEYGTKLE